MPPRDASSALRPFLGGGVSKLCLIRSGKTGAQREDALKTGGRAARLARPRFEKVPRRRLQRREPPV